MPPEGGTDGLLMERAAFLIDATGERIPCLLNPASVVLRRVAGVRPRRSAGGSLTGTGLSDAPLLFNGGGWTELLLDLLFDVSLVSGPTQPSDVHDLTDPLWRLAENEREAGEYGRPPLVRFVWGKSWNVPGVVASVAERLEYFTQSGTPRRSWLRLRLLRVVDRTAEAEPATTPPPEEPPPWVDWPAVPDQDVQLHDLSGDGSGSAGERLDLVTQQYYGRPDLWRDLAEFNDLDDPLQLAAGATIQVPPLPGGTEVA